MNLTDAEKQGGLKLVYIDTRRKIAVKVVDILGNDTMTIVDVSVGKNRGKKVMAKEIAKTTGGHTSPFERIRKVNEAGNEYWESRDLAEVLDYTQYRNFESVIEKAKVACFNSGHRIEDHFADVSKMIEIGKGGRREIAVALLSRYACYLVIQNADPNKEIVAQGQTYFAVQTRRQELADERIEEQRRLLLRDEMRRHNAQLADAARGAGVVEPIDYAIFQNHGYMGLYGGLKQEDIHRRKGLKKSQKILDHMGSTELAANLFRKKRGLTRFSAV